MNIVLFQPEIPGNTGNIARTCVATGTILHLIEPLGFKLEGKEFRRAGLDYWPKLKLVRHASLAAFEAALPKDASVFAFATQARRSFRDAPYRAESWLLFGRESTGLPEDIRARYESLRIPTLADVRSLNLATSVAVGLFEALRVTGWNI